ncbi:MAG: hypothetical protein KGI38_03690 [Thaumarchaeota archaeon]|nr:hypothetical protein [Nitrososphaerota archaeon]
MNERSVFVTRCLLSASIGDSLYLLGVWFLGSVTVTQSVALGSLTFAASLPLTFALDRRVQSIAERLQGSVDRTRRRINGSVARLGLTSTTKDVTDLQPGRSEPGRMAPATEPEKG